MALILGAGERYVEQPDFLRQLLVSGEGCVRWIALPSKVKDEVATASIPLAAQTGEAKLALSVSFSYCRDGVGGLCKLKTSKWNIPIKVSADGKSSTIKLAAVAE